MKKLEVSNDVKKDLDYLLSFRDKFYILNKHIEERWGKSKLSDLSVENLAYALNYGYELEKTKEEKLKDYYDGLGLGTFEDGVRHGIYKALKHLDIKVEEINK